MTDLSYKPDGEVIKRFMKSNAFFRGIRGPVGSGKSVACCIEIFRRALAQERGPDGIRRTRMAIIRNTNPQLKTTTIKTWLDWFPEEVWGRFRREVPYTHHMKRGDVDCEVIFLALDRPEDIRRLLSLELTMVWVNEARELSKGIIDACTMRVGRYPSVKDGGPTWYGIICDTNAPEEDHWWPIMSGDVPLPDHIGREEALMLQRPDNWSFYVQPSGMTENKAEDKTVSGYEKNESAENVNNLTNDYYRNIIRGKTKSWIDVYVMNRLGTIEEGRPVYNEYNESIHLAKEPINIPDNAQIVVGLDFGLTPAAAFCMRLPRGRWAIVHELVCQDMAAKSFAEMIRKDVSMMFANCDLTFYGDPAGDMRAQTDERTPFQILRGAGIQAFPAPSNDVSLRLESVNACLSRMVEGLPALMVDPSCITIKKGFSGGYHYRRLNVSGAERFEEKPSKNRFSHVHDALQYALIGAGEGRKLINGNRRLRPVVAKRDFNPFNHNKKPRKKSPWQIARFG